MNPLAIAIVAILATLAPALYAQTERPQPQATQPAPADMPEAPPVDEAERHFGAAAEAFARKEYKRAAEEIREGKALVELEAARADQEGRKALEGAASDLKKLATAVEKGSVKDGKALAMAFAKTENALARSHRVAASKSWLKKEYERAGTELKSAALHLENAATWAGGEIKAAGGAAATDARALGDKLERSAAWTRDEVAKGFESLGNAINALGQKIRGNKASPAAAGA